MLRSRGIKIRAEESSRLRRIEVTTGQYIKGRAAFGFNRQPRKTCSGHCGLRSSYALSIPTATYLQFVTAPPIYTRPRPLLYSLRHVLQDRSTSNVSFSNMACKSSTLSVFSPIFHTV